jgi:hypothetical protein
VIIGILREYEYFQFFVEHQLVRKVGDEFVRNERRWSNYQSLNIILKLQVDCYQELINHKTGKTSQLNTATRESKG